jgi:hypothetical protein
MTTIIKNITIDQGADYFRPFTILDETCNPVDITGAIAAMELCVYPGFPAALTLTTANGGLVINGPLGTITPVISAAMTTNLLPGMYVYDIKMVYVNGRTVRPFQGMATVSPEVTMVVLVPPTPGNDVLLEDGSNMLLEDGSRILTEGASPPVPGDVLLEDGSDMLQEDGSKILTEG